MEFVRLSRHPSPSPPPPKKKITHTHRSHLALGGSYKYLVKEDESGDLVTWEDLEGNRVVHARGISMTVDDTFGSADGRRRVNRGFLISSSQVRQRGGGISGWSEIPGSLH